jgi:hypothetical protein
MAGQPQERRSIHRLRSATIAVSLECFRHRRGVRFAIRSLAVSAGRGAVASRKARLFATIAGLVSRRKKIPGPCDPDGSCKHVLPAEGR